MEDLEEVITLHCQVLDLLPQGHPNHSSFLNDLALDLFSRFEQLGGMDLRVLQSLIHLQRSDMVRPFNILLLFFLNFFSILPDLR